MFDYRNATRESAKAFADSVSLEQMDVSNHFLFQQDAEVADVFPKNGRDMATTPLFVQGSGFVNSTQLTCRIGHHLRLHHHTVMPVTI